MKLNLLLAVSLYFSAPVCSFAGTVFPAGNIVVAVEGNGVQGAASGPYTGNQAAPLTLFDFQVNGTSGASYLTSFVLPQFANGANFAISGEYGSSSEGTLQLSGNGKYLTIMGYGVNASDFNANPALYSASGNPALGQSGSLTGQSYTAVPRVVALIDYAGVVDTSTGVYNVFDGNNPRSAYTLDGHSIYISGQGTSGDATGGVFLTGLGINTSPISITGADAGSGSSQDTRTVEIVNNTLLVSADSKNGSTNRDYIGRLGTAGTLPTSVANGGNGPTMLNGFGNSGGTGRIAITAATTNGINTAGSTINLSPENFFFANASTLYVADSGNPKNTSAQNVSGGTLLGDGGLQKWKNSQADGSGTWSLQYTLSAGLSLVPNTNASGVTGLYGLAGKVVGSQVFLYATSATIGDLDQTYLYGITDLLTDTTAAGKTFSVLAAAPVDSTFKGVSFAPTSTPEPATFGLIGLAIAAALALKRRA